MSEEAGVRSKLIARAPHIVTCSLNKQHISIAAGPIDFTLCGDFQSKNKISSEFYLYFVLRSALFFAFDSMVNKKWIRSFGRSISGLNISFSTQHSIQAHPNIR